MHALAAVELLLDMYAPRDESGNRCPDQGIIDREEFIRLMTEPDAVRDCGEDIGWIVQYRSRA